ncbi:MAG: family 10 glycosylhydrolase [Thermodesulfobacteriota bacterium]
MTRLPCAPSTPSTPSMVSTSSALVLLLFALAACAPVPRPPTAAWVVRTALATPEGVDRVTREAREAELHTLAVQVRGRGDAYYASDLAPRAEALTAAGAAPGFDPLARVLEGAGGARVLAWMNVFLLWSGEGAPADPSHAALRAGWVLRDAAGRPVSEYSALERSLGWIEGVYADPDSSAYREHFAALVREVASRYPIAGVHLDFVRYPGPGYGHGGALGAWFEETWGLDPRWIPDELRTPDLGAWVSGAMPPADRVLATAALLWADLRAFRITELVRAAREALDGVRPGLELSAAVFPDAGPAYVEKGQDWRAWAQEGLVDALYPMAYFGGPERVEAQLRAVARAVPRSGSTSAPTDRPRTQVRLWAGLGAYIKDPDAIAAEAAAARRLGYDGVSLFDVGSVMEKPGGLAAYARAAAALPVRGAASAEPVAPMPPFPTGRTRGGRWLVESLERASGGIPPPGTSVDGLEDALEARWAEFEAARAGVLPRVLAALAAEPVSLPAWVELRGIFRYVHPLDPPERRAEQRQTCEDARARVLRGEELAAVAREVSQGGTRALGGALGRRYVLPGSPANDALLGTQSGALTPVLEVPNGYWFYRVEARGPARSAPLGEAPWDARRIVLRRALAAEAARAGLESATVVTAEDTP